MPTPTTSNKDSVEADATDVPEELQCLYTQSLCCRERGMKENGERHNLCEYHRDKANAAQRRSAKKRRDENRRKRALHRAQEQAAKSGVTINDLINGSSTQPELKLEDFILYDDDNIDDLDFDEEDLEWLREALAATLSE